jgi:Ala-tRNA(Pro) deacylase
MASPADRVYAALDALGIAYSRHEHPPVHTVAEAEQYWAGIDAVHCKNLFLRNQKGNRHYLVIAEKDTRVDLRALAAALGEDRLSFGSPARLLTYLGLTPGAVSPFGVFNDGAGEVRVVMDSALRVATRVAFHPNVNTATIALGLEDFLRAIASTGHDIRYVSF